MSLGGFMIVSPKAAPQNLPVLLTFGESQLNAAQKISDLRKICPQIFTYQACGRGLSMPHDSKEMREIFKFLGKLLSLRNLALENHPGIIKLF